MTARVLVVSDDGRTVVEVVDDDEGYAVGRCRSCPWKTDVDEAWRRDDVMQASVVHVDREH